jgi:L-lactate dehydrogenase complex protein LldG
MNGKTPGPVREFLESLRQRVQHARAETPLPGTPTSLLREVAETEDLAARFAASAETAGCRVHRAGEPGWLAAVREIVRSQSAKKAIVEAQPETALTAERAGELRRALEADGVAVSGERDDESLFTADIAVTGVRGAIAETGTLVCVSGPASARGTSLIPPVHVAVVATSQVVGDLFDAFDRLGGGGRLPANVNLITGPSKTADIEGILITGVHGPGIVHIVLV